jgi:hypothetical protein
MISGVTVGIFIFLLVAPMGAQAPPSKLRTGDGKPNFNGVWQAINTANWDLEDHPAAAGVPELGAIGATPPGQGVVEGGDIPYQPAAAKKKQENAKSRPGGDPEAKCYQPGVPRATYIPYPFQIVQGPNKIMFVYGFAEANRTVHMDKPKPEPAPIDTWMGRSHGRFEGDTLIVDVAGLNGEAWFDRAGNFASENVHIVERYTLTGPDTIMYEATIEDPTVFTRPWKISMPLYRRLEKNARVLEFKCVEFSEELLYRHLKAK